MLFSHLVRGGDLTFLYDSDDSAQANRSGTIYGTMADWIFTKI